MLSNDENPYADISLDLDNLNLDDLPDENSLDIIQRNGRFEF